MIDIKETVDEIVKRTGITDPNSIELITRVTGRAAEFAGRKIAGEDVEKEGYHIRAQASNLGEMARRITSEVITEKLFAVVGKLLNKALVG